MQRLRKTTSVSASPSGRPRLPRRYASPRFRRVRALTAALGAASLMLGSALHADTFNWLASPADTLFENPLNWVNSGGMNGVPGVNDDAVNSTDNVINYLLNAGSNTINSFTNSGGGTLNLNLSDPAGQTFTVNGDVSNLLYTDPVTHAQTASTIDITGSFASTVNFNAGGGTLTNAGVISVHDGGFLTSAADTIDNSGTFSAASNANVSIYQAGGIDDTFTNTGTVSASSGGLLSLFNTTTANSGANALFSADGANSTLGISSVLLTNEGAIRATDGGAVNITADQLFNSGGTIQADGANAASAPTVTLNGTTLTNNANAVLQAINGNAAALTITFNTINNSGLIASVGSGSVVNLGTSNFSVATIANSGTMQATNGGGLFVNAGSITNNANSVISAQGINAADSSLSTLILGNMADNQNQQFLVNTLNNAGEISARTGGFLQANVNTLNNMGTLLASDATNVLDSNSTPIVSTLQIFGPTISNSSAGTVLAQNGGSLRINTDDFQSPSFFFSTFANAGSVRAEGVGPTTQSTDTDGNVTTNYAASTINLAATQLQTGVPSLSNTGTITALNGGQVNTLYYSLFTNNGALSANGVGLTDATAFPGGGFNRNYQAAQLNLTAGAFYGGANYQGGDLTNPVNHQINALNGGSFSYFAFGNVVNNGSLTADGVGLRNQSQADPASQIEENFQASRMNLNALDLVYNNNGTNMAGSGGFSNTGSIHATNGGQVTLSANDNITNTGTLLASGTGATFAVNGTAVDFMQSSITLTSTPYTVTNGGVTTPMGGAINLNNGSLQANNGSINLTALNITNAAPAVLSGDNGSNIVATVTGAFTNAGSIAIDHNSLFTAQSSGNPATPAFNNTGTFTTLNGSATTLNLPSGSVTNSGTMQADSSRLSINANALTNQSGGTVLASGTGAVVNVTAQTVTNSGSINVNNDDSLIVAANIFTTSGNVRVAGSGAATFNTAATQTAGKTVVDGALTVSSGNIFTVQGGRLEGNGTITGAVTNTSGVVTPGSDTSAGKLTETGNYTQGVSGAYLVKLGGTGQGTTYDLFNIGGTASLAGQLQVQLLNSFKPFVGETFDIMTYTNHTGAFDSIFALDSGYDYSVTYTADTAILHVDDIAPVPETGTLVSLGLMIAGGAFVLRRKRKMEVGC